MSVDEKESYAVASARMTGPSTGSVTPWRQIADAPLLLAQYWSLAMPTVMRNRRRWQRRAAQIQDSELRQRALYSLSGRNRLHAEGGALFALAQPRRLREIVRFVVALQAILDYWGALYEFSPTDERSSNEPLRAAVEAANDPSIAPRDDYYSERSDGGYLGELVRECQDALLALPSYELVGERTLAYASALADVEVLKHATLEDGQSPLIGWAAKRKHANADLYWWEIAAAAHTSLAIYVLLPLAGSGNASPDQVDQVLATYDPWICSLHILLDSFVDQAFDAGTGQLNFFVQYCSTEEAEHRLQFLLAHSLEGVRDLPQESLHAWALCGMLALYLTDTEIDRQGQRELANRLADSAGPLFKLVAPMFKLRRVFAS